MIICELCQNDISQAIYEKKNIFEDLYYTKVRFLVNKRNTI